MDCTGLATLDVLASTPSYAEIEEDFRILKMEGDFGLRLNGALTEIGFLIFGLAPADLSAAEIEEALESRPLNQLDVPASEQTMRPIWPLGAIELNTTARPVHIEWTQKWTFSHDPDGATGGWLFWVYNLGAVLPSPTTLTVVGFTKIYGVWVK